jgi:hypothetical protein
VVVVARAVQEPDRKTIAYSDSVLHQPDSWSDLLIDKSCLMSVILHHSIMPEFSAIVSLFSKKRDDIHEAFCGPILLRDTKDLFGERNAYSKLFLYPAEIICLEIGYILKYPGRETLMSVGGEPWVIRQIGVYQQYSKSTKKSIWMLLCCRPNSEVHQKITHLLQDIKEISFAFEHPVVLHLLLASSYLHNWQDYMGYYESELLKKVNTTFLSCNLDHEF